MMKTHSENALAYSSSLNNLDCLTLSVLRQSYSGEEELCCVYVPTNHLYIGDVFLIHTKDVIRPNLSVREGIGEASLRVFSRLLHKFPIMLPISFLITELNFHLPSFVKLVLSITL